MPPGFSSLNIAHRRFVDAVHDGDSVFMLTPGQSCADVENTTRSQLGPSVFGASVRCAVLLLVTMIVLVRVIAEIAKPVVHWIAVVVANIHVRRARSDERSHHECMNQKRLRLAAVSAEIHRTMAVSSHSRLQDRRVNAFCFCWTAITQYGSIVADEVPRIVVDWPKCGGWYVHA